ncbi:MAG: LamG domain-containing protein, partial [Candidatus Pacebacteria bacterium]|nr:LamG domain-containing protein [Candidatus Paceibacterota bacterium]
EYALDFDGSDDYIVLPANTFPETEGTISAWFKTAASNQIILFTGPSAEDGCGSGVTNPEIDICMNSDGLIKGTVENASSYKDLQSSSSYNDNNWHMTSLSWNSSTISLYIDGIVIDSSALSFIPDPVQEVTRVGKPGSSARYFNGLIDDVRIYNYARTADEIKVDYNNGMAAHLR